MLHMAQKVSVEHDNYYNSNHRLTVAQITSKSDVCSRPKEVKPLKFENSWLNFEDLQKVAGANFEGSTRRSKQAHQQKCHVPYRVRD